MTSLIASNRQSQSWLLLYLLIFIFTCYLSSTECIIFKVYKTENSDAYFKIFHDDAQLATVPTSVKHFSSLTRHLYLELSTIPPIYIRLEEVYFTPAVAVYVGYQLKYLCYCRDDVDENVAIAQKHVLSIIVQGNRYRIAEGIDANCISYRGPPIAP